MYCTFFIDFCQFTSMLIQLLPKKMLELTCYRKILNNIVGKMSVFLIQINVLLYLKGKKIITYGFNLYTIL